MCARKVAYGTSFLSRQRDVIASFFVWRACVWTRFSSALASDIYCVCLFYKELYFILRNFSTFIVDIMASPGERRGVCGHAMAGFDQHAHCARCRDKKKGTDPCIKGNVCPSCNVLTEEQKLRLATPVYQNKKEKRDSKAALEDCTLVDPALVSVLGVSTEGGIKSSEEVSSNKVVVKTKKNAESLEEASNVVANVKAKKIKSASVSVTKEKPDKNKKRQSSPAKPTKGSTDSKLEAMDMKWLDRFNRLEAMLLSKSLSQPEPSFQPVKLSPVKPSPAGIAENTAPFFAPPQVNTKASSSQEQGDKSLPSNHPHDMPVLKPVAGSSGLLASHQHSEPEMDTDSASDSDSLPDMSDKCEEGELSGLDPDNSLSDVDQPPSEEQTYRETMRGIRAYMNWNHIPDMDTTLASSEDNPFAAPKIQPAGKISVQLPTDDWLCRKMDRLNLTLMQGYPAKGSEPGGLQRDQFIKPTKSQGKWYGLHPNQDKPTGSVSFWHSDNAKVNSTSVESPDTLLCQQQPLFLVLLLRIPYVNGKKVHVKPQICVTRLLACVGV